MRAPVEAAVVTAASHPIRATAVEVDRAALCDNARLIAGLTATPVFAVVKADGYGHGAPEVARTLEAAGAVAGFAVSVGACKTMHGIGEDTEIVGEKIQKEADQHTKDDDNQDNRAHDRS